MDVDIINLNHKQRKRRSGGMFNIAVTVYLSRARRWLRKRRVLSEAGRLSGIKEVAKKIYMRLLLRKGEYVLNYEKSEIRFLVSSKSEINRLDNIGAERELLEKLIERLRPGDVFCDVGANIGVISLIAAIKCPGIKVHAFEPMSANFHALNANVARNGLARCIRVHECALSDSEGEAELFVDEEVGGGGSSLLKRAGKANVKTKTVIADRFFGAEGVFPSVIKIDVEGAECRVVSGMSLILSQPQLRVILVEVHCTAFEVSGRERERICEVFETSGFSVSWRRTRGAQEHLLFERT